MRISDWSSDVCSSDLLTRRLGGELLGEGALRLLHLVQPLEQRGGHLLGEAGADAPGVDQLAAPMVAEHQRADRLARGRRGHEAGDDERSEEHMSELQSVMSNSDAAFCLKNKTFNNKTASYYT